MVKVDATTLLFAIPKLYNNLGSEFQHPLCAILSSSCP